jgi:hypothetical protein
MDPYLAYYVVRYYRHFMTDQERLAHRHLLLTDKITSGRSDKEAQKEVARGSHPFREPLPEDPKILKLMEGGFGEFFQSTAERILTEHEGKVFLNLCPQCGRIAKTPKARKCRFCFHDWHNY